MYMNLIFKSAEFGSCWAKMRNNMKHEQNFVLVTGNGFDLNLGLKTRYSDFAKSDEWTTLYEEYAAQSQYYSLLKYLNDQKDVGCWFDIEQALLNYASANTERVWKHDVETDKREYQAICNALVKYLDNHVRHGKGDLFEKAGIKILRNFKKDTNCRKIYTFNYTSLGFIARIGSVDSIVPAVHIHGSIEEGNAILGFNINNSTQIIPAYSFMVKSDNPFFRPIQFEQDLISADEVIIFGHSLNAIDSVYFDSYLRILSEDLETNKRLTIITYNENSRQEILNNIRQMGILVPRLFSRGHIDFILTKDMENNQFTNEKFDNLLKRTFIY